MSIWNIIGTLILLSGTILTYDARLITQKAFGFGDQNEGTMGLKIFGFILSVIGGLLIYFLK